MKASTIVRPLLKLALFVFFALTLFKPFIMLILSVAKDNTDPGVINFVAKCLGMLIRFTIMYIGMFISFSTARKLRDYHLLQVVVGFASMSVIYWLARQASFAMVSWIAALVRGMFGVALIVVIGLAILICFLWAAAGPWASIIYFMLKDD